MKDSEKILVDDWLASYGKVIKVTEAKNDKLVTLIPVANIEYIQASAKTDSKDTHIRLKSFNSEQGYKFFFVRESVDDILKQINGNG